MQINLVWRLNRSCGSIVICHCHRHAPQGRSSEREEGGALGGHGNIRANQGLNSWERVAAAYHEKSGVSLFPFFISFNIASGSTIYKWFCILTNSQHVTFQILARCRLNFIFTQCLQAINLCTWKVYCKYHFHRKKDLLKSRNLKARVSSQHQLQVYCTSLLWPGRCHVWWDSVLSTVLLCITMDHFE